MNTKTRKLTFSMDGEEVAICESKSWLPSGHKRRKWDECRVALTIEELEKALAFARKAKGGK